MAAAWVALFVLVGKVAAAAREIAIAFSFGVSSVVDAYHLAISITTWAPSTFVSVFSVVAVPLFVQFGRTDHETRVRFLRELLGLSIAAGVAFTVLALTAGLTALPILATGLST